MYTFQNSTDKISLGSGITVSTAYTYACWISPDAENTNNRQILTNKAGSASGDRDQWFEFNSSGTNRLAFGFRGPGDGDFPQAEWNSSFTAGSTHFVAGTYDGSNLRIYADTDSTAKATHATSGNPLTGGTPNVRIGNDIADGRVFDGSICEFAIWNRALSGTECSILGKGFSSLFILNGLTAYLPLVRHTNDIIGKNNGTVTGASIFSHPRIIYPTQQQIRKYASTSTYIRDLIGSGFIPFLR